LAETAYVVVPAAGILAKFIVTSVLPLILFNVKLPLEAHGWLLHPVPPTKRLELSVAGLVVVTVPVTVTLFELPVLPVVDGVNVPVVPPVLVVLTDPVVVPEVEPVVPGPVVVVVVVVVVEVLCASCFFSQEKKMIEVKTKITVAK
jgi:hypothetical protein